jgi:hypothetical protein
LDAKTRKIRERFLLTNPERETRKKEKGLIRLHQCALSRVVGKLSKCDCEYITESDANFLERNGAAGWIGDGRDAQDSVSALVEMLAPINGVSGMQLFVSAEEWESLCAQRDFNRREKNRRAMDKKNAKKRQETFERKSADLVKRFQRLLETQNLGFLEQPAVIDALRSGAAMQMFENPIAKYSARQIVEEYWNLVLDVEDMHEEAGIEIVVEEPEPGEGPHSSGLTDVYFPQNRASKGEKPRGATNKWTSGGYSTLGDTDEDNTNLDHLAPYEFDSDGNPIPTEYAEPGKPDGARPDK